ncbi:MAG: hypothetical protein LBT40_17110 [Deltaproteobacteria bacterium]|jgi:hypothetical protein|nr:hypothetical protein [Deltaproteobacteria bacterium]
MYTLLSNRISSVEINLNNRISSLESNVSNRINALDTKFDTQTQIIAKMQADIARLDSAIIGIFQGLKINYNVIQAEENPASGEAANSNLPSATSRTEQLPSPTTELKPPASSPDVPSGS